MKVSPTLIALTAILLASCKTPTSNYQVHHRGALKTLMHEGDLRAVIALDTLQRLPNLFALGAVENLKGEILIYDSRPFASSVKDDSAVVVDRSFHHKAALLVYAQVSKWREIAIPAEVRYVAELEAFLLMVTKREGINAAEPFPFLLTGAAAFVDWHVVNWTEGDTIHTHEKHKASGLRGRLENQIVELLGFYSDKHQGIFTHRGSNVHLHVKTVAGGLAAHVDDLKLSGEMSLFLPEP